MTVPPPGPAASTRLPSHRGVDPLGATWRLLTNVKFALLLVGLAVVAGMLGTVLPQVPAPMRENAAARAAWMELRREDFGDLTPALDRLGLFDVFHAPWFTALWAVIIIAVTVCTVSRLRPTWRSVARPPRIVPDSYFEHARYRASVDLGDADSLAAELRRRRYAVTESLRTPEAVYLFADRFPWSRYGTFLSHLALLLLLVGALLTVLAGYSRALIIPEGTPAVPVFADPGPGQVFIRVLDTVRGSDDAGNIIDYHTDIEVRQADTTVACRVTVNGPCGAFGYRIHQAAFFDDLAELRIADPAGRVIYDGVLDFQGRGTIVPAVRVTTAAGAVLLDEPMPQLGTDPGTRPTRDDDVALGALTLPGQPGQPDVTVGLAWEVVDGDLRLLVSTAGEIRALMPGGSLTEGGFELTFTGPARIPAILVEDMPGAGEAGAIVQLVSRSTGGPYLVVSGIGEDNLVLPAGARVVPANGLSYVFGGRADAAGLDVRRDPGDTFIWLAVGMGLAGLAITFYTPRRRLWLKVTPRRTWIAGQAERTARLDRELAALAADLER